MGARLIAQTRSANPQRAPLWREPRLGGPNTGIAYTDYGANMTPDDVREEQARMGRLVQGMTNTYGSSQPVATEHVFASGAKRSRVMPRYDLIPREPFERIARRFEGAPETGGAYKYGLNNWQKGLPYSDTWNHVQQHLQLHKEGDRTDDHLAAAAWGCIALMWYEEHETVLPPDAIQEYWNKREKKP